jgi:hypothetical protein
VARFGDRGACQAMRGREAREEGRERVRGRDHDAGVRLDYAGRVGGTGATAMMAHEAAADDHAESPCQEGADQPTLGLRWHGLLNRGVIDNQ